MGGGFCNESPAGRSGVHTDAGKVKPHDLLGPGRRAGSCSSMKEVTILPDPFPPAAAVTCLVLSCGVHGSLLRRGREHHQVLPKAATEFPPG